MGDAVRAGSFEGFLSAFKDGFVDGRDLSAEVLGLLSGGPSGLAGECGLIRLFASVAAVAGGGKVF